MKRSNVAILSRLSKTHATRITQFFPLLICVSRHLKQSNCSAKQKVKEHQCALLTFFKHAVVEL